MNVYPFLSYFVEDRAMSVNFASFEIFFHKIGQGQVKIVFSHKKFSVLGFKVHTKKSYQISNKTVKKVTTVAKTVRFKKS